MKYSIMKRSLVFIFVIVVDGAYEGDLCSVAGVSGVCTDIRQCPAVQNDRTRRPQNCGFSGSVPIVCCPSSAPPLTTTRRSPQYVKPTPADPEYDYVDQKVQGEGKRCDPIPASLTARPTGHKAWDKCVEYQERLVFPCVKSTAILGGYNRANRCYHNADELIIGGEAAGLHEFPHMALLGYSDAASNLHWLCGGSLISEKFVLTAGHCTSSKERWNVTHVQLGSARRSSMPANHRHRVSRVIKHPQYASPNKYHDIALLELEAPVPLSAETVPACLHSGSPVDDSRAAVTGWGLTANNGQVSDTLQKVVLTKFERAECSAKYRAGYRHLKQGFDHRSQLCFGDKTQSRDTCNGDSGGPLQIKNKQIACMYTVVGVTSFGDECGMVGVPGIYTRVAHYMDWIESIVWP